MLDNNRFSRMSEGENHNEIKPDQYFLISVHQLAAQINTPQSPSPQSQLLNRKTLGTRQVTLSLGLVKASLALYGPPREQSLGLSLFQGL